MPSIDVSKEVFEDLLTLSMRLGVMMPSLVVERLVKDALAAPADDGGAAPVAPVAVVDPGAGAAARAAIRAAARRAAAAIPVEDTVPAVMSVPEEAAGRLEGPTSTLVAPPPPTTPVVHTVQQTEPVVEQEPQAPSVETTPRVDDATTPVVQTDPPDGTAAELVESTPVVPLLPPDVQGELFVDLRYTKPTYAAINGVGIRNPRWVTLLIEMLRLLKRQKGFTPKRLVAEAPAAVRVGEVTGEGYIFVPDLGISVQGKSANECRLQTERLARKYGYTVTIEFVWFTNAKAQYPGKTGRFTIEPALAQTIVDQLLPTP